jgi:hypothetical protein
MKHAFDSSDDEVVELRSRTKKSTINNEEPKQYGYLLNILKIFRHLQKAEAENFEKEFKVSTSVAIHDFANRLLRSSKVYDQYKKIKAERFGIEDERYISLISELKNIFLPITQKYFSNLEITDFGIKVLFNLAFDHTCTLPPEYDIEEAKLKQLKSELLSGLVARGFSSESQILEILTESYSDSLQIENAQNSPDNPHFFISLLLDIRNIKNITKASAISSIYSFASATHLKFPSLGLGMHAKKVHTVTVSTQSSNSMSKVTNITTYKDLLSQLPTSVREAELLKSIIFDIINGKATFPLDSEIVGNLRSEIIAKMQNLSSDLTHLFFVECTRNNATIITFPMWLELWASNPAKYLNSFPMDIKGAVASARQIHAEFSELIFQPIFLDLDSTNARDADQLLTPEYQLIMDWCEYNNITISRSTLKELGLTFMLDTKMQIERSLLTAGDLFDIFSAAENLFSEERYGQHSKALNVYDRKIKIPEKDAPTEKPYYTRYTKKTSGDDQALLSIYNQYLDIIDQLRGDLQCKKRSVIEQEIAFVKGLFLSLEQKMLDWYSFEVPENLKIGDVSTDFAINYFSCAKRSPFKKQKRVRDEDEELQSDSDAFPEMFTPAKHRCLASAVQQEETIFHDRRNILDFSNMDGVEQVDQSIHNHTGDIFDQE